MGERVEAGAPWGGVHANDAAGRAEDAAMVAGAIGIGDTREAAARLVDEIVG
jgi:hypothetical protein